MVSKVDRRIANETSTSNRHDTERDRSVEHISEAMRIDVPDCLIRSGLHSWADVRQRCVTLWPGHAEVGRNRSRDEEL